MNNFSDASTATPTPAESWQSASDAERRDRVQQCINAGPTAFSSGATCSSASADGHVIISLLAPLPANVRGTFLLDLEEFLKRQLDAGLTVWLEPLGDKSSLRNLRGIEVKS